MNDKLTIQNLIDRLAVRHEMTKKDAEAFVKEFFLLIEQGLEKDRLVKVKGLGTFKLVDIDSRESVNIQTGERFQIQGYTKVAFMPDGTLRDTINKPFSHFETVVLNDDTLLENTPVEEEEEDEEEDKEETVAPIVSKEDDNERNNEEVAPPSEESKPTIIEKEEPEASEEMVNRPLPIVAENSKKPVIPADMKDSQSSSIEAAPPSVAGSSPKNTVETDQSKSPISYLIVAILIVLLLCGGAVFFIYYPDLFSSSSDKEQLDMPSVTQEVESDTTLSDALGQEEDTTVNAATETTSQAISREAEVVADRQTEAVAPAQAEVAKETPSAATQHPSSFVYEDGASYRITGTMAKHTIKVGETLTKVSLHFYGTKALWPYIVKHNSAAIKNPDNVPYGTRINIPQLQKIE